jgi:hypothetical protein
MFVGPNLSEKKTSSRRMLFYISVNQIVSVCMVYGFLPDLTVKICQFLYQWNNVID